MKFNMKKLLLTGTAIVAVSSFAGAAQAADLTIGADATWASAGGKTGADVANANAGDNVDGNTAGAATLTITNDGTADDGSANKNTFSVGNVTNTGAGDLGILIETGSANDMTATIASGNIKGDMAVSNRNADDAALTATVTNGLTVGGTLNVSNFEDSVAKTVILNVGGNLNATGQVTVTAGGINGAHSTLNLSGNATFTGGAVLNDNTADRQANLNFNGTTAQTVTGTINGAAAGEGNLIISNAAGVTFNGVIGGTQALRNITIDSAGTTNAAATFKANVSATTITLGGVGTGTNTINFDTTGGDMVVTGALNGASATETNIINVTGGHMLTNASNWGALGNINAINITGTDTRLRMAAFISNVAATTIGTGAFLQVEGDFTITSTITNNGTILATGASTLNGDVSGTGSIRVENNVILTVNGERTISASEIVLEGGGPGGTLRLQPQGNTININAPIKTVVNGQSTLSVFPGEGTINLNADVGTSTHRLNAFTLTHDPAAVTVNTTKNLYVNNINIGEADVLNLTGTNQVVSGAINGTGAGNRGTVNIGDGTVNASVTFGDSNGATNTINTLKVFKGASLSTGDDIYAGTAIIFDGTFNAIAREAGVASFDLSAPTISIDGVMNVSVHDVAGKVGGLSRTLTLDGATTIGGNRDTVVNANSNIFLTSALELGSAGNTVTINLGRNSHYLPTNDVGTTITAINAGGNNVTIAADATVRVGLSNNGTYGFDNGHVINVVENNAGGDDLNDAVANGRIILQNTALISLDNKAVGGALLAGGNDLSVRVIQNNPATVLQNQYSANTATALMNINDANFGENWGEENAATPGSITNPTGRNELRQARNNLLTAPTAAAATEIAESLAPTVDGGHIVGAMNTTQGTFNVANDRLAALRTGSTGMAAGNGQGNRFWVQGHGTTADQDRRSGVDGYDADSYGFAVGLDTETLSSNGIVGVAFSYADTEVDSRNANRTKSDIDSYQVTLYGSFDLDHATFINGMLAYTWHDVDTTRHNVGGINGLTARGSFDANQFSAQAVVGRDYKHDSMTVTPSLLAHWTHYDGDNYTETGAGNAGLVVNQDSVNKFELGAGVKASWDYQTASGMDVVPELRAGYRYDFIGDEVSTTNRFIGGGQAFTTKGADPAQHSFNAGGSLSLYTTDSWEFTANYDFDFKTDYHAHSGYLRAGVKF